MLCEPWCVAPTADGTGSFNEKYYKYANAKADESGSGESYLESALSYENGFTMDYSYTFDRSYGDEYGYVQADVKDKDGEFRKKLSFVGNGGVKYGSTAGASKGVFEAAILDVRAMIELICKSQNSDINMTDFATNDGSLYDVLWEYVSLDKENGEIQYQNNVPKIQIGNYEAEAITRLLDLVGYGDVISSVYQYQNSTVILDTEDRIKGYCVQLLVYAYYNTPVNSAQLTVSTPEITINSGETTHYRSTSSFMKMDNKIYLQAHWGSGVTYVIGSISKTQN